MGQPAAECFHDGFTAVAAGDAANATAGELFRLDPAPGSSDDATSADESGT
jgi:hypothetical protein